MVIFFLYQAFAREPGVKHNESNVTKKYFQEKEKVSLVDQKSRIIMSTLYEINGRMKNMSKKRDTLNNKMIGTEGDVKSLAKDIADLENKIKIQRKRLSKRLKAIYMLGDEGVVRVVFSSASAQDLDQSIKYLRLISDHDFALIKSYEANLKLLNKQRDLLKKDVKKLIGIKEKLRRQEEALSRDQDSKSSLLSELNSERKASILKMANIRESFHNEKMDELFNISFYENRGKMKWPAKGILKHEFGLVENETFHYRLSHKGLLYKLAPQENIFSIFHGMVAFIGQVDGYGNTIIIDHGDHYYSVYSNLEKVLVSDGQRVGSAEPLARVKNQLYFEIRHFSDAIDPKYWLQAM